MKHFYNSNTAASKLQPTAKATGTAIGGKIFTFLLLYFFLLVSGQGYGQVMEPYNNNFNGNPPIGVTLQNINGNRGTIQFTGTQLQAIGSNGNADKIGYDGYLVVTPRSFDLRTGFTYTVSFEAKAGSQSGGGQGNIRLLRGNNAAEAGSTSGVPLTSTSTTIAVAPVSAGLIPYSITFTVSANQPNQFIALRLFNVNAADNNSNLYLDNLSITEACTTPRAPTVTNASPSRCGAGNITLAASGAQTWESYRWYTTATGGTAIAGATGATYTTSIAGTYYVSVVNDNSICGNESTRTAITAVINPIPEVPSVENATVSRCGEGEVTLVASGLTTGQSYRWYTPSGALIVGEISGSYVTSVAGTYSVSIVNNVSGCESERIAVTVIITPFIDSSTNTASGSIIGEKKPEAGKPAIYSYDFPEVYRGDIVSRKWQIFYSDREPETFDIDADTYIIPSVSEKMTGIAVLLRMREGACYRAADYSTTGGGIITISNIEITPLPVELVSFSVKRDVKGAKLMWKTASELDNKGFEVQVSTDSRTFAAIGFVESKVGTTSLRQEYSFLDTKAVSGTRYYRLKQTDLDGTTSLSPVRAIVLDGDNSTVAAYPNPFSDVVTVKLTGTESRQVRATLTDAMGKVMLETVEETAGNSISVNTHSISTSGMYMLHIYDNDTRYTFKLMKR